VTWPAAIATLGFAWMAAAGVPVDATDRLTRTIELAERTPIRIDATIAELAIAGSDRADLSVDIVRHAPSSADLRRYPAAIEERADGLHIAVVQEDDGRDARLKTEIAIQAPAAAIFEAVRVFEGRVRLTNLHGTCDVNLQRGPIDATRLAGRVRLEAGLGSVDVKQADLTAGGMMRLRVFNGPLHVRLDRAPANARVLAVTFNGKITSDIPLTMKDRFGPRFGETTIGSGEPVMSLDVVKGDITINVGGAR